MTLDTLRARVRARADMEGSAFVEDHQVSLDAFINGSLDALYDLILKFHGEDYFLTSEAFVTVASTATVALPSTFYKMRGIDLVVSGDTYDLKKFNFKERNTWKNGVTYNAWDMKYRIVGSTMLLVPTPTAVYSGTFWFHPVRTQMAIGTDTCAFPNGWEEWAVVHAAIKCKDKEESDISALVTDLKFETQRIEEAASGRDESEPERVADIEGLRDYEGGEELS